MIKKIVTIGGGTGSFAILSELRRRKEYGLDIEISAIVAMSDSGGSSGILMDNYGVLPAGDLRQCLVALSSEADILRELFTFRYEDGFLEGHSFGNIFISTLEKISGNLNESISKSEKILNTQGRVYPVSFDNHELIAELKSGEKIISEKNLDNADLRNLKKIYFNKDISLNPKIPKVLQEADIILINPGSFYTSIIPNFLVKGMTQELEKTKAKKIFITNIVTEKHQTDNFNVVKYLEKLEKYSNFSDFDYVLYNNNYKLEDKEVEKKYLEEGKFFVKRVDGNNHKNIKFIGDDFMVKPDNNYKKHLIRTDAKKVIDKIFKIYDKEKIYIFDLDHTLINAKKLREDIGLILENNKEIITEHIWNAYTNNNKKLIGFLEKEMEKYIFNGVLDNLKKLKGKKILLSFGQKQFQRKKIEKLGLHDFFDNIVLTEDNKIHWIKEFYKQNKDSEIIFINDNYNRRFHENDEVRKEIPEIKVFEVDNYSNIEELKIINIFKKMKKVKIK